MSNSEFPDNIADGSVYEVVVRPPENFTYKVVALNHPHQASSVVVTDKKACVKWMLENLRTGETMMEDPSISVLKRNLWAEQAADLRRAAEILTRSDWDRTRFFTNDTETASVISRALIYCGKANVVTVG